jgi:hypothetical protein
MTQHIQNNKPHTRRRGQNEQILASWLFTVKPDSLNLEYATHNQGKRRIQVKIEYTIDSKSVVFRVFIPD